MKFSNDTETLTRDRESILNTAGKDTEKHEARKTDSLKIGFRIPAFILRDWSYTDI